MFCTHCGAPRAADTRFCGQCGNPHTGEHTEAHTTSGPPAAPADNAAAHQAAGPGTRADTGPGTHSPAPADPAQTGGPDGGTSTPGPGSGRGRLLWLLAATPLLAAAVGAGYPAVRETAAVPVLLAVAVGAAFVAAAALVVLDLRAHRERRGPRWRRAAGALLAPVHLHAHRHRVRATRTVPVWVALAAVAAGTLAVSAHRVAQANAEREFFDTLKAVDIAPRSKASRAAYLEVGHTMCTEMDAGTDMLDVADAHVADFEVEETGDWVEDFTNSTTAVIAGYMVATAAVTALCPEHFDRAVDPQG